MLVAIGSVVVSIIAVVLGVAALNPLLHAGAIGAALLYVVMVAFGIGLALRVDERRKAASVWLTAFERRIR
ncbi:ABC-type multidrug transport system permease subunit [Mycetocola sp. CAN_C7]